MSSFLSEAKRYWNNCLAKQLHLKDKRDKKTLMPLTFSFSFSNLFFCRHLPHCARAITPKRRPRRLRPRQPRPGPVPMAAQLPCAGGRACSRATPLPCADNCPWPRAGGCTLVPRRRMRPSPASVDALGPTLANAPCPSAVGVPYPVPAAAPSPAT